jgi:predicted transposase YbfD/YdcC
VSTGTLAVDGKTIRGSGDGENRPIHMVSAFATECGLVLGQEKVSDKSNEISAIPELLDNLLIRGYLVSIDAMGCQSQIAAKILEQKADYLLAVKGNQPSLQVTLQERFGLAQREALQQAGQYARFSEKPMAASCGRSSGWLPTPAKWMLNTGQGARCWAWSNR